MSGSVRHHASSRGATLASKALTLFVAFTLAFGLMPLPAYAQEDGSGTFADAHMEENASSKENGADGTGYDSAADSDFASEQVGSEEGESADPSPDLNGSSGSSVPSGSSSSSSDATAGASPANAAIGGAEGVDAQSLSEDAYVLIQAQKDQDSTYSYVSGAVSAGTELWANMYEPSDYFGADVVAAQDGWAYQWLQSDEKSGDADAFTPIEGQTSQSLTVTDELAGKYIAVKVTEGGNTHYGPRTSSTITDIIANYLPGPVLKAGQAELYKVDLDKASPAVGDTLTATAYTDWSTPAGEGVDVAFTWQEADSAYGAFENIPNAGNGSTFTLTEAQQGKYIRVIANAGVNDVQATTSDPVMAKGAVKLLGVKVEAPDSLQMPVTLTAKAYTGSSYSPDYVEEGVTYTWKYAMEDPSDYTFSDSWQTVEGETGPTLTVDDESYAGAYFSVEANAGANTVELSSYSAVGPMKLQGQVDISAVSIVNDEDGASVFVVGDTATARVREIGAPSGQYVDASLLNFQWKAADSKNGDFSDIPDANGSTLEIDESLEGKYLRCEVSSKVGQISYTGSVSLPVGAADAVHVTSVKLDKSGKVNVGDTITATASAAQEDVTSSEKLEWAWYSGDDQYSVDRKIEGADGNTLEVTDDLLGKYIEARADGGFGEEASAAVGPVVVPGAVELYRVEAVGDAKIGSTVSAKAYKDSYSTSVEASDAVSYQWQYAESNTTSDAAFMDIPDATQADFTIPETIDGKSAQGLYLRVKATSDGTVVSTHQKGFSSYYPSKYVDPLGPISLKGQYTLTAVELESSGQGMQAGSVITPTAMVEGSYLGDDPAPADAKLTFTWYAADAEVGSFDEIEGGYDSADGKLALSADLAGKYVKVEASALDNTVQSAVYQVLPENTYDLLRVITSPAINGSSTLLTGDTVKATAYAKRFDSSTTGDDVTDGVSIQWYVGDEPDGDFSLLNGATSAQLQIPAEAAGKYLKVVATSGAFSVEQVSAACVEDAGSLAGLVAALENESWRPDPVYGVDSNINDVLEAKLSEMGASDVQVRVKAAEFRTEMHAVAVDVSSADDETNGRIAYAKYLPEKVLEWVTSLTMPRSASITFVLSRDGEGAVEFTPSMLTVIPWDEDACEETLRQAAQGLAIGYAQGDSADSVTQDVTLPHSISAVSWKTSVSWVSESDAIEIEGDFWGTESTGAVTRSSIDQSVTLVATVGFGGSDVPQTTVDVPFEVTVKADQKAIAQEKAELLKKVDAAFTEDALTYMEDGSKVEADAVTGDLKLPNPSALSVDGKYYEVVYSASGDSIQTNGYRGNVYQPLPGAAGASVELTLTVTSKSNPEITASKTIRLTVSPLSADEVEAELALMEQAKAGYADALADGQDVDAVEGDLATFQKAYLDAEGDLAWARDYASANAAGDGIVAVDLEPEDEMGVVPGHWFKSSDASVVAHDTLLVTQPEYNTQVTVSSALSSEKFARYAERYADDPAWGETFAQLANQPVSATFTVRGATGMDDPNAGQEPQEPQELSVNVKVIGVAEHAEGEAAEAETWIPLTEVTVDAEDGATAWDVFAQVLEGAGYEYACQGYYVPYSITSPDGVVLGSTETAPYSYWSFIVNGEYASVGANSYSVQDGDVIELVYVDGAGVQQPEGDVELNPDAEHPSLDAQWQGFAGGGSGSVLQDVPTATDGADLKWKTSLLTDEERAAGASCASSDPLIIDGKIYVVSGSSTYDAANNWAETKSLARLQVLDRETGKVERETTLARGLDSLCRMVYADGIIVIPLAGGYLQAVSASTLETLWVVDAIDGAQSVSSLEVFDGYVYATTVDSMGSDYFALTGTIRRVNLLTGALAGVVDNGSSGYYWAGGISVGSYYLVGDDSGKVSVYEGDLSSQVSSVDLGASVRSTLVEADGFVYAVTNNGVLHKLELSDQGSLREVGSVKFANSSTSTPSISGKTAYVGGGEADYTGILAAIDLDSMTVVGSVQTYSSASTTKVELPAEVKSAPLVSVQDDSTYVYFTCNNMPGALYCYKQGDAEATMLYLPDSADQNYSMSSAFAGVDGTLYFINDSGNLFALAPGGHLPSWGDDDDSGSGDDEPTAEDPTAENGAAPLILSRGPSVATAPAQDAAATEAASSDAADGDGAATAEARALSAAGDDAAGASPRSGGIPSWLPFVGIAVGICGLVAALVWILLARKRSGGEREAR